MVGWETTMPRKRKRRNRCGSGHGYAAAGVSGLLLLAGCAAGKPAMNGNPEMPYPPKVAPKVEEIYHLPTGLKVSVDGLMDMLAGARMVSIGETHDNLNDQRVELTVVRELHRRFPGKVAIGMEMFREPQQEVLDRWARGELTELEFLKASRWHETWGFDFGAYRDLLLVRQGEPDRRGRPESARRSCRTRSGARGWETFRKPCAGSFRKSTSPTRGSVPPCAGSSSGTRGTAGAMARSTPSTACSCCGRRRWRSGWSNTLRAPAARGRGW